MTKTRRLGMGMKPREEVPTTEGQTEPTSDPIQEQILAAVEGGDLESVSAADEQPAAEAEPEEKTEASAELQATQVEEPPFSLADRLDDMLKASGGGPTFTPQPIPGREFSDLGGPSEEELARSIYEDGKAPVQNLESGSISDAPMWFKAARSIGVVHVASGDDKTVMSVIEDGKVRELSTADTEEFIEKVTPILMEGIPPLMDVGQKFPITSEDGRVTIYRSGVDVGRGESFRPNPPKAEDFVLMKDGRRKLAEAELGLGELPTGEYRHTVRIPEGYLAGVTEQAKADNMNLEDWLTFQLRDRLEQWFFAPGQK